MGACVFLTWFVQGFYVGAAQGVTAEIDIPNQTMTVKQYGETLYNWKVSTGRTGYRTPGGIYRPQRMHKIWYSKKYDNAPMPYAIFFNGGYAIHGTASTGRLGYPASHGCVRLATENARALYNLVIEVGPDRTEIIIRN